jgi:pimeloyl-ACP methyl ester carboxylesterase
MANYVLIPGAWHGAWCWKFVAAGLRAAGHGAYPLTLTGLAERKHLLSAQVSLHTHISDVVNLVEVEDLSDVVLVAHSYGGVVGANAAARLLGRIRHLVWLDAHVPHSGESWGDLAGAQALRDRIEQAQQHGLGMAFPPPDVAAWGLQGELLDWARARLTPQPLGALTRGAKFDEVKVYALPKTYISCEQPRLASIDISRQRVKAAQNAGSWHVKVLATGHDAMLTAPDELLRLLLEAGEPRPTSDGGRVEA